MKDNIQDEPGYRLCHVPMPYILYYENNDGHGNPKFSGVAKEILQLAIETIFSGRDWNHTMIQETQWSAKTDSGQMAGCLGSLDRNESDIALVVADYPTEHYESIDPYTVLFEEPLVLVSAYNMTNGTVRADVLKTSLKSFSMSLWLLLFAVLIIISLVRFMSYKIVARRKNISNMFKVATILLDQKNFQIEGKSPKLFVLCVSVGMFVIINYYSSLMSTEMVIPQEPFMLDSLDKVVHYKGTLPLYYSIFNTYRIFKDAPEGSYKKDFWDKYAHLEKTREIFAELTDPLSLAVQISRAAQRKRVSISSNLWASLAISLGCQIKETVHLHSIRLLKTVLFSDELYQEAFVRNARLRDTSFGKYMKRQARRIVEGGFDTIVKRQLSKGSQSTQRTSDYGTEDSFRECNRGTYEAPDVRVSHVSFLNFGSIWVCFVLGMTVAFVVFLIEKSMKKIPEKSENRRKRFRTKVFPAFPYEKQQTNKNSKKTTKEQVIKRFKKIKRLQVANRFRITLRRQIS